MRKMIITLVLIVNAISLFGQSRTEIYDYFMVPKEFVYNYTDEDGYTSTRRFTVKSAILNFKNDELVGFTLKSDGKAQASFNVYKFINNTPKGMQFWVDDSMQYFVTIVNHSEVEDGLAIIFTSNVNGSPIFGAHFKKRLTAEEKRIREEQERERQKQLEEQQRKEREEAERKARERRSKINVFLAERTDTTYSIESANRSKYNQDKELLSKAIASAVEQFNPRNLDLTVKDSVYIDFMGNIKHSIAISGTPEMSGLENAVRKQMEQSRMTPMSIKVPGTDTTCTVTSADFYLLDYRIFTESSALNLKKTKSAVSVKSGDRQFYQNNKSGIDTYLSKGNGIYKVDATVKNTNGKRNTDVSINKFRNINPVYTIGYNYTPFAPVGFAFGINNIRNSNWGAFIKLGGKTASSPEGDIYEVPEYSNKYVGGFYLTLGATCSISKYGYLYAGIGGANRADKNVWQEGSTIHRDVRNTGGFNVEAGVIIRPVKWVGVSVGYNYIAGKRSYGGINIGVVLFLQKGDFR